MGILDDKGEGWPSGPHVPSYAEAKKMRLLMLHTPGFPRV